MAKQKNKKNKDRSNIEQQLGRAVYQTGKMEILTNIASKSLEAVAHKELIIHKQAYEKLEAARVKVVEIHKELIALNK